MFAKQFLFTRLVPSTLGKASEVPKHSFENSVVKEQIRLFENIKVWMKKHVRQVYEQVSFSKYVTHYLLSFVISSQKKSIQIWLK